MTIDLTTEAISKLSPRELISTLQQVDPGDPALKDVDIDVIARGIDPKKLGQDEFADLLAALGVLADGGADLDLAKMDAQNFARIISRASKEQVEAVTSRPGLRERVLDEVFRRMEVHFRTERAGATRAVVHFRLTGGASGSASGSEDVYEAVVEDATCKINKGETRDARATVTLGPVEFLKLATGNASAPVLFMTGKLKVKGDLGFAAGFMTLFDIPKA
ncbi:alkyl sulfatase BDS1-like metallo-beta-lactamase superfamily hydrolase [Saccharothrix ecbatanensis]|uniref:Alkyl sulfatase BDS1-like metallo-beta-lactamase superfamily hydrolase n=1 Tax=Saccharothrix ecbatanensis TaxID=1105145 RepID=A0A7W9M451_9PSEU|nr:SCP2 sterol-binding domain-containing protein [Saccharothrix ecbatanensis]MBB5806638.1 alkyl sulfatase BDS1-like metallo-beta-lactamase superfamily hydrolase [Saccharothrix ecbatanensis]